MAGTSPGRGHFHKLTCTWESRTSPSSSGTDLFHASRWWVAGFGGTAFPFWGHFGIMARAVMSLFFEPLSGAGHIAGNP